MSDADRYLLELLNKRKKEFNEQSNYKNQQY